MAGHLWVADGTEALAEFGSSGEFVKTLKLVGNPLVEGGRNLVKEGTANPGSLSINESTGDFFVTGPNTTKLFAPHVEVYDGTGLLRELWKQFGGPVHVTVDNSTKPTVDPTACSATVCTVYVSHAQADGPPPTGDGLVSGVEKFNSAGLAENFTRAEEPDPPSYIKDNEITGTPTSSFSEFVSIGAVAVDSKGDIYVVDNVYEPNVPAVLEYEPSGEFVQAFTGQETLGLGQNREDGGFGGTLGGLAVDPASGLIAVSVINSKQGGDGAVDEFDPTSGRFVHQITETEIEVSKAVPAAAGHLRNPAELTIDAQGDLYAVDGQRETIRENVVDVYGPGRFIPNFKLAEATDRTSTSAVLNGLVDSEARGLGECYFEYVDEAHYAPKAADPYGAGGKVACVPAAGSIASDATYHAVHADVTGLASGTTYRYRIVATTSGPLGGAGFSEPVEFTAPHAPRVDSTSVANVSSMYAELRAQVDPLGADTTYHFQYVDEADFSATGYTHATATPTLDVGSGGPTGNSQETVVQHVAGLAPGTVYHFRVIAENALGVSEGELSGADEEVVHTFTTLPEVSRGLPDERAYELVTPPNKGSAQDLFGATETEFHLFENRNFGYAAMTGDRFLLEAESPFGPYPALERNASSPVSGRNVYVFSRSPGDWQTIPFGQSSLGVQSIFADAFNPQDLSEVGIFDQVGAELSVAGAHAVSLVASLGGPGDGPSLSQVQSDAPANNTHIVGASRDLGRVLLASKSHVLAPGDEEQDPGTSALYEFAEGRLTLVNVDSEGTLLNRCGALAGQNSASRGTSHNSVSADGSKIFFTAPDPIEVGRAPKGPGCWNGGTENAPQLYMRSAGRTIQVSAPEELSPGEFVSDPTGQHAAVYVGASEDGAKVFFITETELTREAAELNLHDPELYEYDTDTGVLTRVSAGEPGSPAREPGSAGSAVFTVPAVSAEGTAVYFTAFGQLTPDAGVAGAEQIDLYRYDTMTGRTAYVTTVNPLRDYPDTVVGQNWWPASSPVQIALYPKANWYTTPDGRYLMFGTAREPSGYNTTEASPGDCPKVQLAALGPNGHCEEVYRYDSVTGQRVCVSCDSSGAAPVSNAFFAFSSGLERPASGPVRAMSDDGSRVFFETADPLVAQDTNGTLDVYEWEAQGSGGCELANGCAHLISSGTDPVPSYFLGADSTGSNVFFGTHARLVPQDGDTAGDVYDARVCTSASPCIEPPPGETAQCEGGACQNPPPAPIDATPGSLTFSGAGNFVPSPAALAVKPKTRRAKCRKGFVRKKGKCVRTKPKRKAKKSNHRRGR